MLDPREEQPGGPLAAVISDGFWRERFNADPNAVGSTIQADSSTFTIVGVLAPGLQFRRGPTSSRPRGSSPVRSTRGGANYRVIARLNDESLEQAKDEILSIAKRLEEQQCPDTNKNKGATVVPLKDLIVGESRPPSTC